MARTRYSRPDAQIPLHQLPGAALRAVFREGYSAADFKSDLLAGLVVGTLAIPLAMALAIAVGAPPQQGIYTSIIAGFLVALLGGSRMQVTGPTAAFIVILAPIQARYGLSGLLLSGLMGGFLLILMGLLRLGRLIEFIPHPVTTGFTAGIATVIATLQLKDLLGLKLEGNPEHFLDRVALMWGARATASGAEIVIGAITLVLLIIMPRITRRLPAPILVLPLALLITELLVAFVPGFSVATIASRFQTVIDGVTIHGIPPLPPLPLLPWNAGGPDGQPLEVSFSMLRNLLPGALAVAMLGAIESLLSAVVADGMARTRHDPDSELIALGIGNVVTPFFGGIPATGAIARTATNVRTGARSPIASMIHALTILASVIVLAPIIGRLPMAALAGLLLLVAWNMSEVKHFLHTVRVAPKSDVAVLLICYGLTVLFDMVLAVGVGVVLAAMLFMRRMAEVTQVRLVDEFPEQIGAPPKGVLVYTISGPLFFGAAQRAMGALDTVDHDTRVVIIRMDRVPVIDATGLVALESALRSLRERSCFTILEGLNPQPSLALKKAKIETQPGILAFAPDLEHALSTAQSHLVQKSA